MSLVAVKDIRPNPYRHYERYPIKREKVEALRESFRRTKYWKNIVGRENQGGVEIAYGHHRLEALREEYGDGERVEVIIEELDEEQMLQIMARENMEEWGTSAAIEQETVRAVVEAAAEGIITLQEPPDRTKPKAVRYAPSFIPAKKPSKEPVIPYTAKSIAVFLGWTSKSGKPQRKIFSALAALQQIEEDLLDEEDFDDLNSGQARTVAEETKKALNREMEEAIASRKKAAEMARKARQDEEALERKRKMKEAQAAKLRDPKGRRKAQEEAEQLAEDHAEAERQTEFAEERLGDQKKREAAQSKVARRKARDVGRTIAKGFKSGDLSQKTAPEVTEKISPKRKELPRNLEVHAKRLVADLSGTLDPERDKDRVGKLNVLVANREDLPVEIRETVIQALRDLGQRAERFATKLGN